MKECNDIWVIKSIVACINGVINVNSYYMAMGIMNNRGNGKKDDYRNKMIKL